MALSFETAVVVSGGHLPRPVVVRERLTQEIDDVRYLHCCKRSHVLLLLLGIPRDKASTRPLSSTDIFEQLIALRDAQYNALAYKAMEEPTECGASLTQSVPKRVKVPSYELPEVVTVSAPAVGDISGLSLKVVLTRPRTALHVELTSTALSYVASVCKHQIASGGVKRSHARKTSCMDEHFESPVKGVQFAYKGKHKGKVRIRYDDAETSKQRTKHLKVNPVQGLKQTLLTAMLFKNGGGTSSTVESNDE